MTQGGGTSLDPSGTARVMVPIHVTTPDAVVFHMLQTSQLESLVASADTETINFAMGATTGGALIGMVVTWISSAPADGTWKQAVLAGLTFAAVGLTAAFAWQWKRARRRRLDSINKIVTGKKYEMFFDALGQQSLRALPEPSAPPTEREVAALPVGPVPVVATPEDGSQTQDTPPSAAVKRGPGRPPGSKNKPRPEGTKKNG